MFRDTLKYPDLTMHNHPLMLEAGGKPVRVFHLVFPLISHCNPDTGEIVIAEGSPKGSLQQVSKAAIPFSGGYLHSLALPRLACRTFSYER